MPASIEPVASSPTSRQPVLSALLLLALLIGVAGFWGPWVDHKAAALILIGQDMGEFVKFLPEVRDGTVPIVRQLFYLPPFCACLIFALFSSTDGAWTYGRALRALFLLAIVPLSLALLPPAFSLPAVLGPEFRIQAGGVLICWASIPGSFALPRIPPPLRSASVAVLALAASIPTLWQFLLALPLITDLYRRPPQIGWGLAATVSGFLLVAVLASVVTLQAGLRRLPLRRTPAAPLPRL